MPDQPKPGVVLGRRDGYRRRGLLDRYGNSGHVLTIQGFTVIKSELVDRISVQIPHLYRYDAEKIVNAIFFKITRRNGPR